MYLEGIADAIVEAKQALPEPIEGDADDYVEIELAPENTEVSGIATTRSTTIGNTVSTANNNSGNDNEPASPDTNSVADEKADQGVEETKVTESSASGSTSESETLEDLSIVER